MLEPSRIYTRTVDHITEAIKVNPDGSFNYCVFLDRTIHLLVDHLQGHNPSFWEIARLQSQEFEPIEPAPGYNESIFLQRYGPEIKKAFSDRGWKNTTLRTCKDGLELHDLLGNVAFIENLFTVAKGKKPYCSTIPDIFTAADSIIGNTPDLKYPQDVPSEQIVGPLLSKMGFNRK